MVNYFYLIESAYYFAINISAIAGMLMLMPAFINKRVLSYLIIHSFFLLKRRRTTTKKTGTKKIASVVEVNIPPITPVPTAF